MQATLMILVAGPYHSGTGDEAPPSIAQEVIRLLYGIRGPQGLTTTRLARMTPRLLRLPSTTITLPRRPKEEVQPRA
jgi:hypothetical protein